MLSNPLSPARLHGMKQGAESNDCGWGNFQARAELGSPKGREGARKLSHPSLRVQWHVTPVQSASAPSLPAVSVAKAKQLNETAQLPSPAKYSASCKKRALSLVFRNNSPCTCTCTGSDTQRELGAPAGSGGWEEVGGEAEETNHGAVDAPQSLEEWVEGVKPAGGDFTWQLVKCLEGACIPLSPPNTTAGR